MADILQLASANLVSPIILCFALGVIAAPAAGLLALVAPSGGEPNQCAPLLEQMKQGKAPVTVKPSK